ncbi:DUF3152 domain-containing protein [Janibacter sp. CX7]|uniref:DUF3152 domain-containing protein n=1 Tax=Janibacter sp. CX7 TaxID=2963431 RepID=UPI0020CF6FE9|nr:DUF3152 domain-containing protein [Janibacter sp. CX7]UTT66535.1 DUF3152 domain-containing protein [Janibacter sp. CX7]
MSPLRSLAPASAVQARRRQLAATALVLLVVLAVAVGLTTAEGAPTRDAPDAGGAVTSSSGTDRDEAAGTGSATTSPQTSPSPTAPEYWSTGRYTRLTAGTGVRGESGQLVTYRVEVEQGARVTSGDFGRVIDRALSHPRGWTGGGQWRFRRVVDEPAQLTIRLATPATVDKQCEAAGASTDGYTSCRAGEFIMLNLDRWFLGVPHVDDIDAYRTYLVNHEVGHGLGLGHERCPAPGWRAPVMLQQTLGLDGCTANPWPLDTDGKMISGPPAAE